MKAGGLLALCIASAIALLALPAGAAAKPGYYVIKPSRQVSLRLRGSHGYAIQVYGLGPKRVLLIASKGSSSASYVVHGKVSDDSIEADFGKAGKVAVRLHPAGPPQDEETNSFTPSCNGKAATTQRGRFVGSIRFRGEQGYTEVKTKGTRGTVFHSYRQVCKRQSSGQRQPRPLFPPLISLGAASSNRQLPWFSVFEEKPGNERGHFYVEGTTFEANQAERREGVSIDHSADLTAPSKTFTVSPLGSDPISATVSPPAPFSGTASFEETTEGHGTWTGDLKAELPGVGQVPLTGPTYSANLCRSGLDCACPRGRCGFLIAVGVRGREYRRARSPRHVLWRSR
jgi:hypothetical protein